jgi:hypothetical protein
MSHHEVLILFFFIPSIAILLMIVIIQSNRIGRLRANYYGNIAKEYSKDAIKCDCGKWYMIPKGGDEK